MDLHTLAALGVIAQGVINVEESLAEINTKVDKIMSEQSELDTDVQELQTMLTDVAAQSGNVSTAITAIEAFIAQLQSQNPSLDLSGLNTLVTQATTAQQGLDSSVAGLSAIVPPAAPPAS